MYSFMLVALGHRKIDVLATPIDYDATRWFSARHLIDKTG
jgi:hypothetical protein